LKIDVLGRNIYINGEKISSTTKEFDLLVFLASNEGIVLSRENILQKVWGYDYYGDDRLVDAQIKLLRASLGEYRNYIKTLRGVGYKFETK
jgi:DNA-binding response OmpR family regulator